MQLKALNGITNSRIKYISIGEKRLILIGKNGISE